MNDSIHLGRLAGIRIGANWSLLVVFALITWSLAAVQLPLEVPQQGRPNARRRPGWPTWPTRCRRP